MAHQVLSVRSFASLPLALIVALGLSLSNPLEASLPRGVSGDRAADRIFGKPDFSEINPYTTVAGKLWLPHGVVVDRTDPARNRMYIYDAGNNRILGLDLNTCRSSLTDPLGCTADIVIGQPDMSTSACNGDSGFQNYPVRAPASASSLCGLQESQLSISEGGSGASMVVDGSGSLYVTDFWNNRVLKYNDPFGTDSVADDVWGQANFVGNDCNKGMATPDATSLCFTWGSSNNWTTGVDLDGDGNLWVVDSGNNRVLRFPPGSKTADLVLGQSGFTSAAYGTALNQLWDPSAVRVSPTTGWLYVSESRNNRVLVYKPPFVNGMAGSLFGSGFWAPQGIDFDPMEPGSVWIMNLNHTTIELWNESTKTKTREVGWRDNGNVIGHGSGSVGIDSAGNLYVAIGEGEHDNDVLAFDRGAPATLPTKQLFGMARGGNLPTTSGLGSGEGVVVSDGQLIVADQNRLLFWNDPASAVNGQPADGYSVGTPGFADQRFGCCGIMTADKNHHLFVTGYLSGAIPVRIDVYDLPLQNGAGPIQTLQFPFNVLGGGQLTSSANIGWAFTGIAVSDGGELWLGHSGTNRVFRLRNPLTAPLVDVVLGQLSPSGTACNRGGAAVANSLCLPGHVSFDRRGNLFVSDHSLEAQGNFRLVEFPKNLIPSGNATTIYAPAAAKIFPTTSTWQPAFDSHNHMIVGYNPYGPGPNPLGGWFPGIYGDPLSGTTTPDAYLLDYHSMAYSAVFDENDSLYITDLDRSRVLFYDKPTAFLPAILGFSPSNGPAGLAVTITGTNLINTTAVRFNGVSATFSVDSDTQLTATVPSGTATGPISVTTPAGGAGSLTDFGVGSAPTITSLLPASGAVGASVAINGTDFTGATSVTFNGLSAGFTVSTAIKITATVPLNATTGSVTVTTPNGMGTSLGNFTVTPRITGFTPGSGGIGASVMISGANFTSATSVKFNGATATYGVDSSSQITAMVPANATSGPISVTTSAGTGTSATSFTVAPRIISFTPTSGPVLTSVTINGANFTGVTAVRFNGASATFTFNTASKITTKVPSGATTGPISVTTPAGTATSAASFTIYSAPGISGFAPPSGAVGASVTINGVNFTGATSVKFNGLAAAFTRNSDIKITATVPGNATTGKITVTNPAGTATSATDFTVAARITSFTPTSGVIGTSVTINGANFTGVSSVKFNGVSAGFAPNSSIKITATVPAGATTGKISVTTPVGTVTSTGNFTVKPNITGFTPASGNVGVSVTITGTAFTGASSVKFNGASAAFAVNSSTQITATVSANATTGKITVTTAGGTATSATSFTVAPRITSFTPTSGAVGTTVTINGANFTGATSVTFNGVPATPFAINSASKITTTVPAGATTGKISVTTAAGTGTSPANFVIP
jgi:hypothetical protein